MALLEHVDELGGAVAAIEAGFFQEEIGRSAYEHQLRVERGETRDRRVSTASPTTRRRRSFPRRTTRRSSAEQIAARPRGARARATVAPAERALEPLRSRRRPAREWPRTDSVRHRTAVMPLIIEAVRARATVGEIADTLAPMGHFRPGA